MKADFLLQLRWDPNKLMPSVQDFDKKLVEADAYLQILIDQVKVRECHRQFSKLRQAESIYLCIAQVWLCLCKLNLLLSFYSVWKIKLRKCRIRLKKHMAYTYGT